jgi:hypothetical protein
MWLILLWWLVLIAFSLVTIAILEIVRWFQNWRSQKTPTTRR